MEVIPQLGSMEHGIRAKLRKLRKSEDVSDIPQETFSSFLCFLRNVRDVLRWESELGWEELENQRTCS
jgi:hypothetical protein